MIYEVYQKKTKDGKTYYEVYLLQGDKKYFLTSCFESRFNCKAVRLIKENVDK